MIEVVTYERHFWIVKLDGVRVGPLCDWPGEATRYAYALGWGDHASC